MKKSLSTLLTLFLILLSFSCSFFMNGNISGTIKFNLPTESKVLTGELPETFFIKISSKKNNFEKVVKTTADSKILIDGLAPGDYTVTVRGSSNKFTYIATTETTVEPLKDTPVELTLKKIQKEYYVSSSGDDSNNGSVNSPFKTLTKAVNIINEITKDNSILDTKESYVIKLNGTIPVSETAVINTPINLTLEVPAGEPPIISSTTSCILHINNDNAFVKCDGKITFNTNTSQPLPSSGVIKVSKGKFQLGGNCKILMSAEIINKPKSIYVNSGASVIIKSILSDNLFELQSPCFLENNSYITADFESFSGHNTIPLQLAEDFNKDNIVVKNISGTNLSDLQINSFSINDCELNSNGTVSTLVEVNYIINNIAGPCYWKINDGKNTVQSKNFSDSTGIISENPSTPYIFKSGKEYTIELYKLGDDVSSATKTFIPKHSGNNTVEFTL